MKSFDVITIGGASRDVFFVTDEGMVINNLAKHQKLLAFEYGSKIIPKESKFTYGGGGLNAAISLVKLGLKVATVINVGAEGTGTLIVDDLHNYGVHTEFVGRDYTNHTAMSIIVSLPKEDHTAFLYRGANDFLRIHDWRPLRTKWFYVTSLTGESSDILPELFSYARAHDTNIAWNPGKEQLNGGYEDLSSFLEETDILLLNRSEAECLVRSRKPRCRVSDEKVLLKELFDMTKGIVVVTDGENGSYMIDEKNDYYQPAVGKEVVETTGSGDAYGSTFLAVYTLGYGKKHAMKMAAMNAGNVIRYIGAQDGLMTFSDLSAKIELGDKSES